MKSVAYEGKLRMTDRCRRRFFGREFLPLIFCAALSLTLPGRSCAQTVQADQAELARAQTQSAFAPNAFPSGVADGHVAPSPNDSDLGEQEILKHAEGYQPFTVSAAVPFYWTSNVALVRTGEQSDFLVAPMVAVGYQPRITNTLYGMIGVREQLFYYDRFSGLNFGDFNVAAGLTYTLPQLHNLTLRVEYVYDRLTKKNSFDDFFYDNYIVLNVELPFQLGRAQQLSLGVDTNISLVAEPDPPERSDYEIYASYTVHLSRAFSLDAAGRLVLRDYHLTDRLDVSEILAISANYTVTKFLSASVISTLSANQSNHSAFDYQVANVGGLVSLSIKF
jgi:hypothetical protein